MLAPEQGCKITTILKKKRHIWYLILPALLGILFLLSDNSRFQQNVLRPLLCSFVQKQGLEIGLDSVRWSWSKASLQLFGLHCSDSLSQEFLSVEHAEADIQVLPLLWRHINVKTLRLHGVHVYLSKERPDGSLNLANLPVFSSESNSGNSVGEDSGKKRSFRLLVKKLVLTQSSFSYHLEQVEDISQPSGKNGIELRHLQARMSILLDKNLQQLTIEDFSFESSDGFMLEDFDIQASLEGDGSLLTVPRLNIQLPQSHVSCDSIELTCPSFKLDSLAFLRDCHLHSVLATEDFPILSKAFSKAALNRPQAALHLHVRGDAQRSVVEHIRLRMDDLCGLEGSMEIQTGDHHWQFKGDMEECFVDTALIPYLQALFPDNDFRMPEMVEKLGRISFSGLFFADSNHAALHGDFSTDPGVFTADLQLEQDKGMASTYNVRVLLETPSYNVEQLSGNQMFEGSASLVLSAEAQQLGSPAYTASVEAKVNRFPFNGYTYHNVDFFADVDGNGLYALTVNSQDPQCDLIAGFGLDTRGDQSKWTANMNMENVNLQALNFLEGDEENAHLSLCLDTHLEGDTLERLWGFVRIDSLDFYHNQVSYQQPEILLTSEHDGNYAHIRLASRQLNADFYGDMSLRQISREIQSNVIAKYLPSLQYGGAAPAVDGPLGNQFAFRVDVNSTEAISTAFSLPFSIVDKARINGYYYDEKGVFALNFMADSLRINQMLLQDNSLMLDNTGSDNLKLNLYSVYQPQNDKIQLSLNADAFQDEVNMDINLSMSQDTLVQSYSSHRFYRDSLSSLACNSRISVPLAQWKGSEWQLDTTRIDYLQNKFHIENFSFHHDNQYIRLDGCVSSDENDTLNVEISEIDLAQLTQLFPPGILVPKPISFQALLSANASVRALLGAPELDADVKAKDFGINNARMGDLDALARWNNAESCLEIDATVQSADLQTGQIEGAYYIAGDSLFLGIQSDGIPLNFISYFVEPMMSLSASAYGDINVYGKPLRNKWDVMAVAFVPDGELYSPYTNTRYNFSDSIIMTPGRIHFNQIELFDEYNNTAVLDGTISHQGFLRMGFDLSLGMNRLHLMNLPASSSQGFYGEIVASGQARMSGPDNDLQIDLDVKTEDPTNFYLMMAENAVENDYSFIRFVQKENRPLTKDLTTNFQNVDNTLSALVPSATVSVSMELEITPSANLIFVTNPVSGDEMRMNGNGTLRMSYDQNQDLQLFGRYELEKGKYGFTFQDLIHRDFNILQGSSINFSGDLMSADLDIKANYSILNVELSDILDESEIVSMNLNRTGIPVNCLMDISGELQQPEIILGLEFPSADDELRRRIMNVINTDEILNRQIVYLLLLNRFAMTENVQNADAATNNMSAVLDIGLNSLSNQLNRMIYQAMGRDNLSFDLNYRYDDMAEGLGEWQVAMTSQLLDNRLIINGNIGSREDLVNDNTQFIGDFDMEYKFSQDGRWRVKMFNRSNDSRYFKSAITTQGVGVVYKESFNTFSEVRRLIIDRFTRQIERSKAESDLPKKKATKE